MDMFVQSAVAIASLMALPNTFASTYLLKLQEIAEKKHPELRTHRNFMTGRWHSKY